MPVSFDWAARRISTTAQGRHWDTEAAPGTLDKLVYQLALMRDLARNETSLVYSIADGGRLKSYAITRLGEETIEIARAMVSTIKVSYVRADTQRRTTLWCAPAYGYVPVRIEYRDDDGQVTTATLTDYTQS